MICKFTKNTSLIFHQASIKVHNADTSKSILLFQISSSAMVKKYRIIHILNWNYVQFTCKKTGMNSKTN